MKTKSTEKFVRNLLLEASKQSAYQDQLNKTKLRFGEIQESPYREVPQTDRATQDQPKSKSEFEMQTDGLKSEFYSYLEQNGLSLDSFKDMGINIEINPIENEQYKISISVMEHPMFYYNGQNKHKNHVLYKALIKLAKWVLNYSRSSKPVKVTFNENIKSFEELFELIDRRKARAEEIESGIEALRELYPLYKIEIKPFYNDERILVPSISVFLKTNFRPLDKTEKSEIEAAMPKVSKLNPYSSEYLDFKDISSDSIDLAAAASVLNFLGKSYELDDFFGKLESDVNEKLS